MSHQSPDIARQTPPATILDREAERFNVARTSASADASASRGASASFGAIDLDCSCAICQRFRPVNPSGEAITSPDLAAKVLAPHFVGADREHCAAALLDTKHRLVRIATISVGSLDHTFMSPREVFRDALLANAAAIVLAHNHPSGDPTPSNDDESVTRRLVSAGSIVGIEVLDHLVIGQRRWVSLARRGLINPT
ncbi:MAG: DNA repair protein RadC [Nitriliruptoraceae bacterium]